MERMIRGNPNDHRATVEERFVAVEAGGNPEGIVSKTVDEWKGMVHDMYVHSSALLILLSTSTCPVFSVLHCLLYGGDVRYVTEPLVDWNFLHITPDQYCGLGVNHIRYGHCLVYSINKSENLGNSVEFPRVRSLRLPRAKPVSPAEEKKTGGYIYMD